MMSHVLSNVLRPQNPEKKITDQYTIDQSVIEEEKYDGFYAVATNLDDSAKHRGYVLYVNLHEF
mgnify:CR=1 FL=1